MFRFTIRDLLWLTVVVALAVAWWVGRVDRRRLEGKLAECRQEVQWKEDRSRLHLDTAIREIARLRRLLEEQALSERD